MECPSCGREVEDGVAFCPHCGSAVMQPFMTEEEKAREEAEITAAIESLDVIKKVAAKPLAQEQMQNAPLGVAPAERDYSARHRDERINQLVIAMIGALALAIVLFIVVPNHVKPGPSFFPTIAEKDEDEQVSPIGDLPPIEELSAQDNPEEEDPLIAFDAYDHSDDEKDKEDSNRFVLEDSDTRLYTAEELEGLSEWDLEIARNEIFARHGRGFNDSTLQTYFDGQEWYERKYSPEEFDAQSDILNETEIANIALIGEVEENL